VYMLRRMLFLLRRMPFRALAACVVVGLVGGAAADLSRAAEKPTPGRLVNLLRPRAAAARCRLVELRSLQRRPPVEQRSASVPRRFLARASRSLSECWHGRRLGSPDHQAHMTYADGERCPATHPVLLPKLILIVAYPIRSGHEVVLPSGGEYSAHADFFNAWIRTHSRGSCGVFAGPAALCPTLRRTT
jgi:uncharacterized protein DUF1996